MIQGMSREERSIGIFTLLAGVGWSLLAMGSYSWNLHQARETAIGLAQGEARANISKDLNFRRWATSHGGVYVAPDEATPPNAFLEVPDRDVETTGGKRLTLMNPAYMLRQLQQQFGDSFGVRGHITSLRPINPGNAPDPWERAALETFERERVDEIAGTTEVDGRPMVRVIRAMRAENGCLKCHAKQGYKEGDIRGGVSATVSLAPYLARVQAEDRVLFASHSGAWLLGLAVVAFFNRRARRRVAERELAETGLRESEERFRSVIETAQDAIVLADSAGTIVGWNPAATRIFGYRADEAVGSSLAIIIPPDLRPRHQAALERLAAGGAPTHLGKILVFRGLCRDGREIPVELSIGSWTAGGRAFYGAVIRDATERQRSQEHQRLTANVFEFAHEGIVITDNRGRIVDVNATFLEITGYDREDAIGQTPRMLRSGRHPPEFYDDMWQAISRDGFWRGEIWNRRKNGDIYPELLTISAVHRDDGSISHYVGTFADITQIKAQQQRLELLAHYDPLTQLPNRVLLADRFYQALAQSQRTRSLLVIGFLDLDNFKPINDTMGHAVGDRLLVEVADRIRGFIRAGDTVARLGGDEFVLLLCGLESLQECDRVLNRLLKSIAAPYTIDGHTIDLSASMGVTLYPSDGADPDTLIRHADHAMYVAKQSGRNRYHLFDPEQDRQAHAHREAYLRIEAALAAGEFRLHYQPKVDMRHGTVVGAEALIRWQHPERGLLPPSEFLPLIEDTELAIPLGEWVIDTALRQIAAWRQQGIRLSVSVNIAARHLQCPNFTERLRQILARYPDELALSLEFEVLETAALDNIAAVAQVINDCKELGITFAIDDFGTGYSSLSYLKRLPARVLKIDQSFVRGMLEDPEDLAIVEGITSLTRAFGREVIAEGVESPEHGLVLLRLGCSLAQGYGIARPMPAEAVAEWIETWQPDRRWQRAQCDAVPRNDFPLLAMELEHKHWIQRLSAHLHDPAGEPAPPLDPHGCRFGRWYYGVGRSQYGHLPVFRAMERVHDQVHNRAQMLASRIDTGNRAGALQAFDQLSSASEDLLRLMEELKGLVLTPALDRPSAPASEEETLVT